MFRKALAVTLIWALLLGVVTPAVAVTWAPGSRSIAVDLDGRDMRNAEFKLPAGWRGIAGFRLRDNSTTLSLTRFSVTGYQLILKRENWVQHTSKTLSISYPLAEGITTCTFAATDITSQVKWACIQATSSTVKGPITVRSDYFKINVQSNTQ